MENEIKERFEDMDKDLSMVNVRLKEQEALNDVMQSGMLRMVDSMQVMQDKILDLDRDLSMHEKDESHEDGGMHKHFRDSINDIYSVLGELRFAIRKEK